MHAYALPRLFGHAASCPTGADHHTVHTCVRTCTRMYLGKREAPWCLAEALCIVSRDYGSKPQKLS